MKKSIPTENIDNPTRSFFDETEFAPIAVREKIAFEMAAPVVDAVVMDRLLSAIKWIFLYLPGAAAIHLIMMAFALSFLYELWPLEMMIGSIGTAVFSTFMVMLGVGKLRDLKYLRVVATLFATSGLAAILYSLLILFIPGDYFGLFFQMTLPLTWLAGYIVKRKTDGSPENQ